MTRPYALATSLLSITLAVGLSFGASAQTLVDRVSGYILLQVEEHGEAWYVYPDDANRYFLGRPADAFDVMRNLGLGIAHAELTRYQGSSFPSRLAGKILLDVEEHGEAYYVYPGDMKAYFLGRPADAFDVMRNLGLGITDADLADIRDAAGDPEPTMTVVDTGQRACYDASERIDCPAEDGMFFGQDAQYAGAPFSYSDNGDYTIMDDNTGLMWQKDSGEKVTYEVAATAESSFGGYDDWRLPTIKELYTLMDFRGQDIPAEAADPGDARPFLDRNTFVFRYGDTSAGDRLIDSQWATSSVYGSTVMDGQECFFGVNFADGRIKCYPTGTDKGYYAIRVRGPSYGKNLFRDNGDFTVTDLATGMMWAKYDSGQGMLWDDALAYCEDLVLAGRVDWRLPDIKELQNIVDYDRGPDITAGPALDDAFGATVITNEAGKKDYGFYWSSTTHVTYPDNGTEAAYIAFGRALGDMPEFGGWVDVHGAGAQRSDTKDGVPEGQEDGFGPQGDARRSYNHVRCVRGGKAFTTDTETVSDAPAGANPPSGSLPQQTIQPPPPAEAISTCDGSVAGAECGFIGKAGETVTGVCAERDEYLFCEP